MTATWFMRGVLRRGVAWLGLFLLVGVVLWANRQSLLTGIGSMLVAEDPLAPVEVIVVSKASAAAGAIEAGRLYREMQAREVVVPSWIPEPAVSMVRELGIPFFGSTELVTLILERSGVPADAIRILPDVVDGTETEIAAVGTDALRRGLQSLLFITARDHSARARYQLQRRLPATRIFVRAPRTDEFQIDTWWRSRELSREVLTEYLRWFNTLILRDPWGRTTPIAEGD